MKKQMVKFLFMVMMIVGLIPFGVVTAFAENGVPYLDANGETQTADHVTEITEGGGGHEGWCILRGTKNLNTLNFYGSKEVHLILENNADITVNGSILLTDISLTIYAQPTGEGDVEGKLTVKGSKAAAGIGSGHKGSCGNITINGGIVTANSIEYGAGIGSGYHHGSCGNITINGGTVIATGGANCPGIGSGFSYSTCGNITINGGTVIATGSYSGPGIGPGINDGKCGVITLNGGNITATGSDKSPGIGVGFSGSCSGITITGTPEIQAGNDADSAEIVNQYEGQQYVNVAYVLKGGTITPGLHIHYGTPQTGVTKAGKEVKYYKCDCGKIFEDEACTKEITDLNAWLAKGGSEDPTPLSGNGNPATGITGNGTWGITLMIALLIGLIFFGIKRGGKEY